MTWHLYEIIPPRKWKAGHFGAGESPFYFHCADCGAEEPEIKGFIATEPDFAHVGVITDSSGFHKTAMFCAACFDQRVAEQEAKREEPVPA